MQRLWGLVLMGLLATGAQAASFNCDQAGLAADERAICAHRDLNDADVQMATMYKMLGGLFLMGTRHEMQEAQSQWLRDRQGCGGDVGCLRRAYRLRIDALQRLYDGIDRPI